MNPAGLRAARAPAPAVRYARAVRGGLYLSAYGFNGILLLDCEDDVFGAPRVTWTGDKERRANVVFAGKDGVFMKRIPLKNNGLELFAQIRRHVSPDYQTLLVSI